MSKYFKSFLIIAFSLLLINSTFAQEWSSEQKDVWSSVEAYWSISSKGDVDGFLNYFDDSYTGWNNRAPVPNNKANVSKYIRWDMAKNSTVLYTITPVSIWVKGEFAFVHYYFSQVEKDKEGKETMSGGRWTDILMKKGSKWVLVGDAGGRRQSNQN
jgi:ketosteroid isomerase-like protein